MVDARQGFCFIYLSTVVCSMYVNVSIAMCMVAMILTGRSIVRSVFSFGVITH